MLGLAILLGFHFIGLVLKLALHIPLPANVIGLILFTAALFIGWVKLEWVEDTAQFLLKHMMLFFAPFVVGTIVFFPLLGEQWLAVSFGLVGSLLAALIVTGGVTQVMERRKEKEGAHG